ncbi:class II 3-deoxy-7-phosphoheptulonate synthase [Jonesia denitrificans]|uniref:Phospho-2-dehydro-3-deoxyheptonate aldolase n=1 Tax=Jonesia denitrificans (strain ATCC 14870 / DSM 20603 / BCRC 15368 / CIP 55.134 / JCM 11481 / NBRC 15587 / NCTC 10816 / Prevot 55134) TaxID=471856 RepID=C7R4N0_JONDD|nr:3-deoxy-7-phosphoheptulonate synthase class II [Jonesia denitrificans]ACV09087.1 phospho-2-dehydro-3-deoxyheptonate aldolase [Jonesia denitrificans DSM 20603]ASE09626.1 3-deoxy-7-phosphoheptulonate synthase class II [Jonesia denitrificans]QXB44165.1 3-deoxy-7-phosphoheptulonate synthase class II [Jonesia denitrificans]SQH21253.1 Phospho-2-dehydro-3-deoxyheptonate aldolase [Jonesia denitrificans]
MTTLNERSQLQDIDHFRALEARQQPVWPDSSELADTVAVLADVPPIVLSSETESLREQLAAAGRGEAFLLQGGDCAETFAEANAERIRNKIRTILQMAVVLTYGASMPVIKMGRMAGQYAKPRSSDVETRDGVTLPVYRGDMVNSVDFTEESRRPDPRRLVEGYRISSATATIVKAFTQGGFADLRRVHEWNRGFMRNPAYARYERTAAEIDQAIRFMAACGADFDKLRTVDFFVSHEALLLDYERAMVRVHPGSDRPYDSSGHFLWIGERTRQLDGAHVDFLSRVSNPIGVKLGPTTTADDALALQDKLNPEGVEGRLTFVTRMGATKIREVLPGIVEKVTAQGGPVTWVTDPMHGNTITSESGYKTRRFDDVLDEVRGFFEVHHAVGSVPGGVHVELTGDDVTEVMGGSEEIDDASLALRYETLVDPRLNHQQSLEMAFLVAEMLRSGR